jgi:Domain of unknown function (DUF4375)
MEKNTLVIKGGTVPLKDVYKVVDDNLIDAGNHCKIIDPIWWKGNIYGTFKEYEASLKSFSKPQRLVYAIAWYEAEVSNGGHDQFFMNSTGIVWKDALKGLVAVGAVQRANILKEAANRIGEAPSFEREERNEQVDKSGASFNDLDLKFYNLEDDLYKKIEALRCFEWVKSGR